MSCAKQWESDAGLYSTTLPLSLKSILTTNKTNSIMKRKETLSNFDIEMLRALMSKEVRLLRVFPYTSHTRDVIIGINYCNVSMEKDSMLHKRCLDIRKFAKKYGIDDNKIVIQVYVNPKCGTIARDNCLFIGFWDENVTIGYSVQPCMYSPKEFPNKGYTVGPGLKADFSTL